MFSFKRNFATIIFIIFFIFLLFPFTPPQAESQQQDHPDNVWILTLDQPASSVLDGEQITFTGRYYRADGVENPTTYSITIRDWDGTCFFCTDDWLASGTTDSSGYFSITWTAYCEDNESPDCSQEIFAQRITGNGVTIRTQAYDVAIIDSVTPTLTADNTIYERGETMSVTVAGTAGDDIILSIHNPEGNVEVSNTVSLASNGLYSTTYQFSDESPVGTWEIRVTSPTDKWPTLSLTVELQTSVQSTILTLDNLPSSVTAGDTVTFTGRLTRSDTGEGLSGQTISIYDWDGGAFDGSGHDLLGIGTTDSNGYFSIDWIAEDVDQSDDVMEVYAYFAGTDDFASSATAYYSVEVEALQQIVTPTISTDKSTYYRGETATISGTANPNEELQILVTYPNNTIETIDNWAIADSEGIYGVYWLWEESESLEPYGIYNFEVYSPQCDCRADTSVELIEEPVELTTTLTFDIIPSSAVDQQAITFTGHLIRSDTGEGIEGMLIEIQEYDGDDVCFFCSNTTLVEGYTDQNGYFSIPWTAYCQDSNENPCTLEIFAEFSGTNTLPKSNTPIYNLAIVSKTSTSITLDQPPSLVTEGETVTFTGQLMRDDGSGISGETVYVYDLDSADKDGINDDLMGTAVTDENGYYTISWVAEDIDNDDDMMDTYAYFPGTAELSASYSDTFLVEVIFDTMSLTVLQLDDPPTVTEGESVTFTGRLVSGDTGAGISGMTITIYESDILDTCFFNCQNKSLASGITDNNGYYSVNWNSFCEDTAESSNCRLEVFARFDGASDYRFSKSEIKYITFKQLIQTSLVFDTPASNVNLGDSITFTGRLSESSSNVGIPSMTVSIFDYDGATSELLATGITDTDGRFNIGWIAEDMDINDDKLELFAQFNGSPDYKSSKDPTTGYRYLDIITTKLVTEIMLDDLPSSIVQGRTLEISGHLIQSDNGEGIPDAQIKIIDYDSVLVSDLIGTAITNQDGSFSFEWTAECTDNLESICVIEIYASFEGNTLLKPSETLAYDLQINTKSQPVLSLDEPPSNVISGTEVTFTGRLVNDEGNGIPGATVEILDFDISPIGESDDILSIGITNNDGFFEISWVAKDTDQDDFIEIYALFRGNSDFLSSFTPTTPFYELEIIKEDVFSPQILVTHKPQNPDVLDDIVFTIYVNDNFDVSTGIKSIKLFVDGNNVWVVDNVSEFNTVVILNYSKTIPSLDAGEHTYYAIVTDNNDNWGSDPVEGLKSFHVEPESSKSSSFLTLNIPQTHYIEGDVVEFSGTLTNSNGNPIPDVGINIFDDFDDNAPPRSLIFTTTDENGNYAVSWQAECNSNENPCSIEAIASFDGSLDYSQSSTLQLFTVERVEFVFNGLVHCIGSYCNETNDVPIPNVKITLTLFDSNLKKLGPSHITYSDQDGKFSFDLTNVYILPQISQIGSSLALVNSDIYSLEFLIEMTDDQFVIIIDDRTGSVYTKSFTHKYIQGLSETSQFDFVFGCGNVAIGGVYSRCSFDQETNDQQILDMDVATLYTYQYNMANFFVDELGFTQLLHSGPLHNVIFPPVPDGKSWLGWYSYVYLIPRGLCFELGLCTINIPQSSFPSENILAWKDVMAMEYIHAVHDLAGGTTNSFNYRAHPGDLHTWWIENFGTFLSEAIQYELNDRRGAGSSAVIVFDQIFVSPWGNFLTCGSTNLDSTANYLPPGTSTRGDYCRTSPLLWDIYDNPSIPDSRYGQDEDELASVSLLKMWQTLSHEHITLLGKLYDILLTLDVNNDGSVNSADANIIENIFSMHGIPGGIYQR